MFSIVSRLFERFQARRADSSLDFEAELLARAAQRKAVLLRQAARYHDEGLTAIAEELRHGAEAINFARPMSSLLPLTKDGGADSTPIKPAPENGNRLVELTRKKS